MNAATVVPLRRGGPPSLLVVEDEILVRCALCAALRDRGFKVMEANSGTEALAVLDTVPVHLLFVDLHLPGAADGWAVARFARSLRPAPKIILTSGKVQPPEGPELAEFGPFVPKPYRIPAVLDLVSRSLDPTGRPAS